MMPLEVFFRMLASDFRSGAREVAGRFALALLMLILVVASFRFLMLRDDGTFSQQSFIDCFASLFGGMEEFDAQHDGTFPIPASWLCVCLVGAFIPLSYPRHNLETIGIMQCMEARGRWCWWLSKCVWTVACAFAYWACAVAVALLASGSNVSANPLKLSQDAADVLGFFVAGDCLALEGSPGLLMFVIGVPFALAALCLIQLAVCINVNPFAAFAITASLLFHAAFYLTLVSLGNYLMLARSLLSIHNGVDAGLGILVSLGVAAAAIISGGLMFGKRDLLGKEQYGQ